ncbi:MAG: cation:proton antiporter [Candidatus Aenigmatarchaeota archaeon]|nr:MAG: cation:proton antiporter [Candidatus Aenigmarchaeota archaeon]RLJ07355.1 MAG: cation:proton antiporter [Candidatus Aenigmarchaeota archaeon]RLJ07668.1 MAG: cation:proton antiporter [Candidatus Aenigmarchaeota archaeon]
MLLEICLVVLVMLSVVIVEIRDLLHMAIIFGAADILLAFVFLLLAAPDVAITQAAVGSALTTFILIIAVKKTRRLEE